MSDLEQSTSELLAGGGGKSARDRDPFGDRSAAEDRGPRDYGNRRYKLAEPGTYQTGSVDPEQFIDSEETAGGDGGKRRPEEDENHTNVSFRDCRSFRHLERLRAGYQPGTNRVLAAHDDWATGRRYSTSLADVRTGYDWVTGCLYSRSQTTDPIARAIVAEDGQYG